MWHDNETQRDLVGYKGMAETISALVTTPELLPLTVGLYGSWGSGKSSVLSMIDTQVRDSSDVVCVRFDGWQLESVDDLRAALMSTVLDALEARTPAKETLGQVRLKVDWLRAAGLAAKGIARFGALSTTVPDPQLAAAMAVGESTAELVSTISVERQEPSSYVGEIAEAARDFRAEFAALVADTRLKSLVVLIDDLDRCLPESVVAILESIKLFMAVPGTAFVLAMDEDVVGYAVSARFAAAPNPAQTARNYLDKLIQVPVLIPHLSHQESENFIYLLYAGVRLGAEDFDTVCAWVDDQRRDNTSSKSLNFGVLQDLLGPDALMRVEADFAVAQAVAPLLSRMAGGNPRTIKRFLNTIELRLRLWPDNAEAPDKRLLAKLLLLERFHKERFAELGAWQASGLGRAEQAVVIERIARGSSERIPSDGAKWLEPTELVAWLKSEPSLDEHNLSPYFHMAEVVAVGSSPDVERLSSRQQGLLVRLRSQDRAHRQMAIGELKDLEEALARQVVGVLEAGAVEAGIQSRDLEALLECSLVMPQYAANCMDVFKNLPTTDLTATQVMQLGALAKAARHVREPVTAFLEPLAHRGGRLGTAAQTVLVQIGEC